MTVPELSTRVGHAAWGENYYFGHAVNAELAGSESYTGLVALAVGGKRLSHEDRAVLDDIAVVMTVADARIWPLKMARVIASYGSTLPGVAAANLCIERAMIGHWTSGSAAALLVEIEGAVSGNVDDRDAVAVAARRILESERRLMGFGVPFRECDERVESLRRCLTARAKHTGRYWRLLETLSEVLAELKGLRPNVGAAVGAACLDLGFDPHEVSLLSVALGQTDYLANAREGAQSAPEMLRNLPESMVNYVGRAPRQSPRKVSAQVRRDPSVWIPDADTPEHPIPDAGPRGPSADATQAK